MSMETREGTPESPKGEWWPLVLGFCIAVPIILAFAYGMARASENHEVRPVLVLVLIVTVVVPGVAIGAALLSESVRDGLRRWIRRSLGPRDRRSERWDRPRIDDLVDQLPDAGPTQDPMGSLSGDEYSAGPGFSLMRRFRRPIPNPERRA